MNPKSWIIVASSLAAFATPGPTYEAQTGVIAAVFFAVGALCLAVWVGFGAVMRRFLASERAHRRFNVIMAALLVASMVPVLVR